MDRCFISNLVANTDELVPLARISVRNYWLKTGKLSSLIFLRPLDDWLQCSAAGHGSGCGVR